MFMIRRKLAAVTFFLIAFLAGSSTPFLGNQACLAEEGIPVVHHDLKVEVRPSGHWIRVCDRLTLPQELLNAGELSFMLNGGLEMSAPSGDFELIKKKETPSLSTDDINGQGASQAGAVAFIEYVLAPAQGAERLPDAIELSYEGEIHHPLQSAGEEYARSFSQTRGIISDEGTLLSASSGWYPQFGEFLNTFRMNLELPQGRASMTEGRKVTDERGDDLRRTVWDCPHPMDDIYLIEAAFVEYEKDMGDVKAQALMRAPDPGLAGKYLDATARYIEMYSELIGPYPFSKFALVENFWETGYGMPSFTLLGPRVIRFPFILQSSYPHEILHNWWGNSVFVDYEKGNWCEGLTAYLADHLMKEVKGQGEAHRRDTLQRYVDYVRGNKDFPLVEFRSRHDAATEAIGYGKSLMIYHMLRRRLGDDVFVEGLREFYKRFIYKRASFHDLAEVFSGVSGEDLRPFFATWTERGGAPGLRIADCKHTYSRTQGTRLTLTLAQVQEEDPFPLRVPVAVYPEGAKTAQVITVDMDDRTEVVRFQLPEPIIKVEVDPAFDLFRKLDREEIPPTLGQVFGADKVLIVLPEDADPTMRDAWRALADQWSSDDSGKIRVLSSREVTVLPAERAVWIFGRNNPWKPKAEDGLNEYKVKVEPDRFELPDATVPFKDHAVVIALRHPHNPDLALCWITADVPESIPGLGRKLPHYGKYSYLAFEGTEPTNMAKGQWPLINSPMQQTFDDGVAAEDLPKLPRRSPLTEPPAPVDVEKLRAHITFLADDSLNGRGLGTMALDEAADYIARCFAEYGLKPGGEMGSYFQAWQEKIDGMPPTDKGDGSKPVFMKNVVAVMPGRDPKQAREWVVIGAHYDHLGLGWPDVRSGNEGRIHNGADDNASGVAALLELARMLSSAGFAPAHSVAFVAFTGEEAGLLGSKHFVADADALLGGPVVSMINLDSVGRLGDNKVMVFGTWSAREWPFIMMGCGYVTGLGVENVPNEPGAGDQVSFLDAGIPAIHIFSGPHLDYHRPTDDIEKIDFKGLSKIVEFTKEALVHLADRTEPLDVKLQKPGASPVHPGQAGEHGDSSGHPGETASAGHPGTSSHAGGASHPGQAAQGQGGRASLGTMPDFAWQKEGVRIAAVTDGSPASKVGLKEGDVILAIDDKAVKNLRGFSNALKSFKPGDAVTVKIMRGEEEMFFAVTLGVR